MIQPGTIIGDRYQVESLVDEGGMAQVFRARDLKLNRILALKIIRQDAFSPYVLEEVFGRFEIEAATLAKLSHPNIIGIIDFGKHEGIPYVVMTYVAGGTLRKFQGQPMPVVQAVGLLIPIARALSYAHRHGCIHRDIKPSNILLTESDEPMLSDFGLVKDLDSKTAQTLTSTGASIGTPEYMAPEQAVGEKVDDRADVYSLGVVFYELVTGRRPFKADTPVAMLMDQASGKVPDPREANPNLSDRAAEIIRKALAVKADDRFQTMGEFKNALEELRGAATPPPPTIPPPAYDSERTMITPSKAVSFTPPPEPFVGSEENNATVQMPPLRPPAATPPPSGGVENMPTLQMRPSTPISQPRGAASEPGDIENMPTLQMGVSLPISKPRETTPENAMGNEPTVAMPALKPPQYAPPPDLNYAPPAEAPRRAPSTRMLAMAGGGIVIVILLILGGLWAFGPSGPLAGANSTATNTPTEAAEVAPTARPTNTPANTAIPTSIPTEKPTNTPVPTPTPLLAVITQQGAEMILIPAGAFSMGCDSTNIHEVCIVDEEPVHTVMLDAYYIDKFEVTNEQYRACVLAGTCKAPQEITSFTRRDYYTNQEFNNYPVIYVTWNDASAFCTWRGGRLPTEAEWEKAARGTIDQRVYPWGNNAPACGLANFNPGQPCKGDPFAVGSYPDGASLFGVMDIAGNVNEWVADWFLFNYYASSPAENPQGPGSGESKVLRGGSWTNNLNKLQVSNRDSLVPSIASNNIGFRCAWTP